MSAPADEIERLVALEHEDPHRLLGVHPAAEGVVVRAFRPDAIGVALHAPGRAPVPLSRVHPAGIFETRVPAALRPGRYRFEVRDAAGRSRLVSDPYSFGPTLGEIDEHLFAEGRHEELHERLGARPFVADGVAGVAFSVWAPDARSVSVVGDFDGWDGRLAAMRRLGASGIWELFVPEVAAGARYKFEVRPRVGPPVLKTDPVARAMELPPATASVVWTPSHAFADAAWLERRALTDWTRSPMTLYEVHLGSWRRGDDGRVLSYRELAPLLADYVTDMGFTHVELMPVMEHPFGGSWGYQVSGYFAPSARWGTPDDFRSFVDTLHARGIGVVLDWVPAHFPRDAWALGRFDGTALYEHLDPRSGEHPDWGTYVFNYGRTEVREFLVASALAWLDRYHCDGLRVDAVASMLYLDYSRKEGEWLPNRFGGRENLDAVDFLRELNAAAYRRHPGVAMIAEESTAWPKVSHPTWDGGLGFGFKWNMGWMHDTLEYFAKDPLYRQHHHKNLNFGMLYAYSENFILPLSHDEVVHGKGSLYAKMPGERGQKLANLRALYAKMWAYPGKKLLFMGGELAQPDEWSHERTLDWDLLQDAQHRGVQALVRDLNRIYLGNPALWQGDSDPRGFLWLDVDNAENNVLGFLRRAPDSGRELACVCNFADLTRVGYRLPLPSGGRWQEVLNTDASIYGGANIGNHGSVLAEAAPLHAQPFSATMTLAPLSVIWLEPATSASSSH